MSNLKNNKCIKIEKLKDDPGFGKLIEEIAKLNIFEATGLEAREIHHSHFLYFLFNPKSKHDLKGKFLRTFIESATKNTEGQEKGALLSKDVQTEIEKIKKKLTKKTRNKGGEQDDRYDFSEAEVTREELFGKESRLDLFVNDGDSKIICMIENKIHSKQSTGQLKKYREYLNTEYLESAEYERFTPLFIFLTLNDEPPAENEQEYWTTYNYDQLEELLGTFLDEEGGNVTEELGHLIEQYREFLRRHILDESNEAKICKDLWRDHKDALDVIFEHSPDLRSKTFSAMKNLITETPGLNECSLPWHSGKGRTHRIHFDFESWDKIDGQKRNNHKERTLYFTLQFEPGNRDGLVVLEFAFLLDRDKSRMDVYQTIKDKCKQYEDVEMEYGFKIFQKGRSTDKSKRVLLWSLLRSEDFISCNYNFDTIEKLLYARWKNIMRYSEAMNYLRDSLPNDIGNALNT